MGALTDDLRYAVRVYRRNAGAVTLVVAGLAVAVGLTAAMFAVMNAVMLRSVAVSNQDALRWVRASSSSTTSGSTSRTDWSLAEWRALERSAGVARTVGVLLSSADVAADGIVATRRAPVWFVSAGFFESMQTTAARGRLLGPEDQGQTLGTPVVMHHSVWTRMFGSDTGTIGRTLFLNGRPHTVVGVAPAGFDGPTLNAPAFWAPLETYDRDWRDGAHLTNDGLPHVIVFAERRNNLPDGELRAALLPLVQGVSRDADIRLQRFDLESTSREGAAVALAVRSLLALVLLLACANVATLLLATQVARRPELAARSALGASRNRLIRQLMTEGILLGLVGGAFGSILALWLSRVLLSFVSVAPTIDVSIDWRVMAFIGLSSIASGVMASLVPAFRSSQVDLRSWLNQDAAQSSRSGGFSALVIGGQAALCVTVLACTAMLTQSARMAQNVEVGYDPERVLTASLGGVVRTPTIAREDARRVLEALQSLPEVTDAAVARGSLVGGSSATLGVSAPVGLYRVYQQQTSELYLRVLGADMVRGRYLSRLDVEQGAPVVVIGEALAKAVWGDDDPVGRDAARLSPSLAGHQIVGVAREVLPHDLRESRKRISTIYRPLRSEDYPWTQLFVRIRSDAPLEVTAVQAALAARLPDYRLRFTSVALAFDAQRQVLTLPARVAALSAVVVLLLAAVGLSGLAAAFVRQKRRELAIRAALGASAAQIRWLVAAQVGRPLGLGLAAGAGLATLVGTGLSGVLVDVSPFNPTWVAIGSAILLITAGAAVAGSLRAATRIPPATALKAE